jgi:long-chain acyl-CoA synthetase
VPDFTYPDLPVDGLLRTAAERDPHGIAVRTAHAAVSFGGLAARADRIAAYLRQETAGRPGVRVGVASVLDPAFAAAYYGVMGSGGTVVLVNPLIGEDGLRHVFAASGAEIALVPSATAGLLAKMRGTLPALRTVVVTDAPDAVVPPGCIPLHTALDTAPNTPGERRADPDAVACVQFTTGTTGRPKGVLLTHRNVVANARQVALAHRLDRDSVTVNHLPLYHVMHLNSALYAGACQVLCQDPDPLVSLAVAAGTGATHYYGLPARLHRLAADERLPRAARGARGGPRLTAVLSGGSGLRREAARTLRDLLGVPVVQGYGMTELSPLTHCQQPGRYRPGAVGTPVPGTECRLVDLTTRRPVDVWSTGVTSARTAARASTRTAGSPPGTSDTSTTRKPCGWWTGSTTSSSTTTRSSRPAASNGSSPPTHASPTAWSPTGPTRNTAASSGRASSSTTTTTPPTPTRSSTSSTRSRPGPTNTSRTSNGSAWPKPWTPCRVPPPGSRRGAWSGSSSKSGPLADPGPTARTRTSEPSDPQEQIMVTFVNKLTVHGDTAAFLAVKGRLTAYMAAQPGYVSHQTLRHAGAPNVFLELAVWQDAAAHQKAVRSEEFQSLVKGLGPLATPDPGLYETLEESV